NGDVFNIGPEAVSAGTLAKVTGTPLYQQQFGVAVSLNVFRMLQKAQGKTVGSDAAADLPSLSRNIVRSIFGGTISDWTQVLDNAGSKRVVDATYQSASSHVLAAITNLNTGVANNSTAIYTCRRGKSSGTQAGADIYFLHNRCGANLTPFVTALTPVD